MKKATLVLLTSLVLSVGSFAQTNHQVGDWSIYTTSGKLTGNKMALLQTTSSLDSQDSTASSQKVKLDVVCKNDRVVAVAVQPESKLDKHLVSYDSQVPTVHLRFTSVGMIEVSEDWAVAAGGHSLMPYAQLSQSSLNRTWVDRLSATDKMVLFLDGRASSFDTRELAQALSAVGCTK
jgi:hypothetical protein